MQSVIRVAAGSGHGASATLARPRIPARPPGPCSRATDPQFARLLKPKPGNNSGSGAPIPSATYATLPASPGKGNSSTPPSGMTTCPTPRCGSPKNAAVGRVWETRGAPAQRVTEYTGVSLLLVRDCQMPVKAYRQVERGGAIRPETQRVSGELGLPCCSRRSGVTPSSIVVGRGGLIRPSSRPSPA